MARSARTRATAVAKMRIGVDLGGTKIEAAALDDEGDIVVRKRIDTPQGAYSATVRAVADLVVHVESTLGCRANVGVATPGAISPASGLIKNANSTALNGQALDRDLAAALNRPVRLANDANCFALSEAIDGAGAGAAVVFGVIIGTGVGAGICVDGRVLTGPNAIAGEWGHNPLPMPSADELPGLLCYCGRLGCIETYLSGPGLVGDYRQTSSQVGAEQAQRVEPIIDAAAAGERAAQEALGRYYDRMARALAHVVNVLDPDVIVLGGGLSNLDGLYHEVPKRWGAHVFSDAVATPIKRPVHGDSSGVRGAAWLWAPDESATRFHYRQR